MKKLLSVLLISLLSACAGQTTQPGAAVEERAINNKAAEKGSATDLAKPTLSPLKDPSNVLSKRSVYYDYDSYVVKDEYKPLVLSHAKYLRDHASAKMLVQGNTDERGSREYNLALGQRRAESVKSIMTLSGAKEAQIEAVSLGEEKPKAQGGSEEAYAQNRRGDILYGGEY